MRQRKKGLLTGYAESKPARMITEKAGEKSAFSGARWARENQRTNPMGAGHGVKIDWPLFIIFISSHQTSNEPTRSEPELILHNFIRGSHSASHILSSPSHPSDYSSLRLQRTSSVFSFPVFPLFVRRPFLSITLLCISLLA